MPLVVARREHSFHATHAHFVLTKKSSVAAMGAEIITLGSWVCEGRGEREDIRTLYLYKQLSSSLLPSACRCGKLAFLVCSVLQLLLFQRILSHQAGVRHFSLVS